MRGLESNGPSKSLRGLWYSSFVLLAGVVSTFGNQALAQEVATTCVPAIGRVISLQGNVEIQRAGGPGWLKVSRLDTVLCAGDRLRTDALSRAALFVQPETLVRVDQNTTISVNQTTAEVLVEFHTGEVSLAAQNAQSCGAGYFITRFPRKFKVSTPHMNAAVEGTEFMVESSCRASTLTVLEGQVLSQSLATQESRSLTAGQRIETGPAAGAVISTVVRPVDAVQWVLRFPQLSDDVSESEIPSASECQALQKSSRLACLTERADAMLKLGRVDQAVDDIDRALALDAGNSDAHALRSVVRIAKNDMAAALESAQIAITSNPSNSRAWLALSYAQQASFNLETALDSARRAQALQENSSLVHTRVAELQLSLGNSREAEQSALAAIASNSSESYAHTVLGFVQLTQVRTLDARTSFQAAIERDSFAALPRLGMGLGLIRDGMLKAGREQIEIAVALDPVNSLLRSYAGKAYYEENSRERDELAASQLDLAAEFDPNDPTPGLYKAIRLQTANRPVQALQEIRQSIALNDNRAIYRSQLKLDEDLAVRSASQGRIYRDLGFENLAVVDGWKSVNTDPGDFSGHRLLADTYSSLPRHEVARVNELFTSQLLQPQNLTPVPPQLGESNLFILDIAGPTDVAFNEFNPLFNSDGRAVHASATVGGNDTWGNDLAVAAIEGRWSLSIGQFHFETDGFRPNNDLEQDSYNAFVQFRQSENTSLITELRATRREQGDLRLLFNPTNFDPSIRQKEDSDSIRIGMSHVVNPRSTLLASLVYQSTDFDLALPPILSIAGDVDSYTGEVQYVLNGNNWGLVGGLRQTHREQFELQDLFGEITPGDFEFDSTSAYLYSHWNAVDKVSVTIGASADFLEGRSVAKDQVNPKFGLTWEPSAATVLRLSAVRTIQPDTYSRQDIPPRLEPTQVAGFNQVYAGVQGESEWRYGLGIDHEVSTTVFLGAELSQRNLEIPFVTLGPPDVIVESKAEENSGRAYVYWTPLPVLALAASYQYDERENGGDAVIPEGIQELRTHRVPISLKYFHPSGFSADATATYIDQEGEFLELLPVPPFVQITNEGESFWVLDASISYRLPRRMGIIAITAENLLDEEFRFQDVDPENPDIVPERFVSMRFTVAF